MFCPQCGKEVDDNANVCPFCGAQLKKSQSAASGGTAVSGVAPAQSDAMAFVGIIVGVIGALLVIIGTFLPLVQDSLGIGLSSSLMNGGVAGNDLKILGFALIATAAVSCLFVVLRIKVAAIIFSVINLLVSGFICFAIVSGMNDSDTFGLVKYGAGFFCIIAGAVILLVGSILLKKKAKG